MAPVPSRKGIGGPKTPEGKARSSMNALKHGLTARNLVVAPEDRKEFDRMAAGMRQSLQPHGPEEEHLVEEIIHWSWQLDVAVATEGAAMQEAYERTYETSTGTPEKRHVQAMLATLQLPTYTRYETHAERSLYTAIKRLNRLQRNTPRFCKNELPGVP